MEEDMRGAIWADGGLVKEGRDIRRKEVGGRNGVEEEEVGKGKGKRDARSKDQV